MFTNTIPANSIINDTYRIICPIGNGGTGIIYLAEHLHLRKNVVLKMLKNSFKSSTVVRQEADILKSLHHMYLPQVYDFIELEGSVFTVIDYIEGSDLDKYIAANTFVSEERLIKWMIQMCDALAYLHSRTPVILHNDIKPANIIINHNDDICLIDFNISTDVQDVVLGFTAAYTSPEQYYNVLSLTDRAYSSYVCNIDVRSDLYSLGASFYAMASRTEPSIYAVIEGRQPQLTSELCGMSEGFCNVINKLMSLSPDGRYSSAAETKKALQKLSRQTGRYRKYQAMQVGTLLLSGIMIMSGVWMIFRGVKLERTREFNRSFSELSMEYEGYHYENAIRSGTALLNDDSYSNIISRSKRGKIYYLIAMSYFNEKQYPTAAEYIEGAFAYAEDRASLSEYEIEGSVIYAFSGNYEKAQQLADSAYSGGISYSRYLLTMAQISYAKEEYSSVIEYFETIDVSELDAEGKVKMFELAGDSYASEGKISDAAEMFEKAYSVNGSASASRKIALLYYEQSISAADKRDKTGLLKSSAEWYKSVTERENCTVQDFVNLSKVYRALVNSSSDRGYYSKALDIMKQAELIYPDNYRVHQQLAIDYYMLDNQFEAKKYCESYFKLYDQLPLEEKNAELDDDTVILEDLKKHFEH